MRESWNFDMHSMFLERDRLIEARNETNGRATIPLYDNANDDIDGRVKIAIKIRMMRLGYTYYWKTGFIKSAHPIIIERPFYFSEYPEVF